MNILHTVEFYEPHVGGAETVVQRISEMLAARGHSVTVATTALPEREFSELNGVRVVGFDVGGSLGGKIGGEGVDEYKSFLCGGFDIMMNYAAQQWATDLAFDVLDDLPTYRANVIAPCGYSALFNYKTLRWTHYAGYFNRILPEVLPKYDAAVYHSETYQDYQYAEALGLDNSIVIPNGVGREEFDSPPDVDFRQKYDVTTEYMGLCVANYFAGKGQDRVLSAIANLDRRDFTMVFIGREGPMLRFLRQMGRDQDNVVFLSGIPRKDTVAAFWAADVFVFGSFIEAFPLVILEAMASRTPWVSTDCGAVRSMEGGIVVRGDLKSGYEMAQVVEEILTDVDLRARLVGEGRTAYEEKYSWDAVVDKWEKLYLDLHGQKVQEALSGVFLCGDDVI